MGLLDDVDQKGLLRKRQFARGLLTPSGNPFGRGVQGLLSMLSEVPKPIERDPTYEYGSILPFRKNIATRQVEWSPQYSDLAKSAIDAFTAPGRALAGQIDPNSIQGVMEANNLAQTMMEGGMGYSAAKMAQGEMLTPSTVGMFAGVGAKTADRKALAIAEQLKAAGIPDEQIWKQTGWTSAFPDGKWRFEIPDNASTLSGKNLDRFGGDLYTKGNKEKVISSQMDHPDLYSAYPDVTKIKAYFQSGANPSGSYDGDVLLSYGQNIPDVHSTGLHELQHAIQQREGFARGGSLSDAINLRDEILPKIQSLQANINDIRTGKVQGSFDELIRLENELKPLNQQYDVLARENAFNTYQRLAGEAEARLTQARMNLTPEQRLAQYPVSQFDVPVQDQIVRYGEGRAMSVPKNSWLESQIRSNDPSLWKAPPEKITEMAAQQRAYLEQQALGKTKYASNSAKLKLAMNDNADLIQTAHKKPELNFNPLPNESFNTRDSLLVYKSPSYGNKPGSEYKLIMVDGKPAYARQSDHWGNFSARSAEDFDKWNDYNWTLPNATQGQRSTGFIYLDDLK